MELGHCNLPSARSMYHPLVIRAWEQAPRHLDPKFKASEQDELARCEIVEVRNLDED